MLLLSDRVDDWLMNHLQEFDGKQFQDVARGALDLASDSEEEKAEQEKVAKESEALVERMGKALEDKVSEVRATARLTDSAACLVVGDHRHGCADASHHGSRRSGRAREQAHSGDQSSHPLRKCSIRSRTRIASQTWPHCLRPGQPGRGRAAGRPGSLCVALNKLLLDMSSSLTLRPAREGFC